MRKAAFIFLAGIFLTTTAEASDWLLTGNWQHLETRNNQADDTYGVMARLERPVWNDFSLGVELDYHARQKFPSTDDPKGSFGSLFGYGALAEVIFRPEVHPKISPYAYLGAGGFWWDFKENPFLQDNFVTVDVDPSIAFKVGAGVDWWVSERWAINFDVSYFDTKIDKRAIDRNGVTWNVVGADNELGNEQIQFGVGVKYRLKF